MATTSLKRPNAPSEVGFTKINGQLLLYSRVPRDDEGWVDAKKFLPLRGDLVFLCMGERQVVGWWAGAYWFGSKGKYQGKVEKWRLADFDHETSKFKTEEDEESNGRMEDGDASFGIKERPNCNKPKASRRHRVIRSAQKE